ncbi:MAG: ImmA/IrrE family metallo-endopeptidase [Chloroflexota bacterium]|nr:ImmA/IrrE family metallo-endopeptidase [Chloroflexota bacterium]
MPRGTSSPAQQARRRGMFEAARQHGLLGTDRSQRIPIFTLIQQSECWLMFQPLDHLYGVYLYDQASAGILINVNHPLNLQRFTAAHEYGHYILGHGSSFDVMEQIQPGHRLGTQQEIEAQAFAAHFLMPLQLVNTCLQRMGLTISPPQITPEQVYRLSLELGASYTAVVNHLVTLNKITHSIASILNQKLPKDIKAKIGKGRRPQDPWADVWELESHDTGHVIYPRILDEIHIHLPETGSPNQTWMLADPDSIASTSQEPVVLVHDELERYSSAPVKHHFIFRVLQPGRSHICLTLLPSHSSTASSPELFEITLQVLEDSNSSAQRGLSEQQKRMLLFS